MFLSRKEIRDRAYYPAGITDQQKKIAAKFRLALIAQAEGKKDLITGEPYRILTKEEICARNGWSLPKSGWLAENKRADLYRYSKLICGYTGKKMPLGQISVDHILSRRLILTVADYLRNVCDHPATAEGIRGAMNNTGNLLLCLQKVNKDKDAFFWSSILRGDFTGNIAFLRSLPVMPEITKYTKLTDAVLFSEPDKRYVARLKSGKYNHHVGTETHGPSTYTKRKLAIYRAMGIPC